MLKWSKYIYTNNSTDGNMKSLGKRMSNVPKVEPRSLLPSSIDVTRGSTLGFNNHEPSMEQLLDTLAEIIVEAFFHEINNRDGK
jgi:hypothetical protein